ncbi:MAG: thiamine diphosphokinase [Lachnospiraceae bacterium]|nr:thiamine diphosphokinase [Lachnospiraceae bacterium]
MKKCVIVGSAIINNYEKIKEYLTDDFFYVYCDGGLKHLEKLNRKPDLIVGDFDSHENPHMDVETIVLPCEKDDTDTCHALKVCIEKGFDDFLLIGCIGERLDHTLGNVSLLLMIKSLGLKGKIIDDYSEMEAVSEEGLYIDSKFSFFSLLTLSDKCEGINIRDAKYPLENAAIESVYQYGVSNEVKAGCEKAFVSCKSGNLLLIRVF